MFRSKQKYRNYRVEYNDMKFDSKLEMNRYLYLSSLEKRGEIFNLRRQVKFVITPRFVHDEPRYSKDGRQLKPSSRPKTLVKASFYKADFVYEVATNPLFSPDCRRVVVEDTKGMATPEFRLKKKFLLFTQGVYINEIHKATEPIPDEVIFKIDKSTDIDSEQ